MSKPTNNGPSGRKIELYKIVNRLKAKLGVRPARFENDPGHIDLQAIQAADLMIAKRCETCPQMIANHLANMSSLWIKMRDMPESAERESLSHDIMILAHEIKDIGSLCGYTLAAYFAESLRDYIGRTELNLQAQRVIIQAHVDALTVVNKQGMKEEGGPAADELRKMVKRAIEKYK